jgi:lipoprotein-releasing system permease protein
MGNKVLFKIARTHVYAKRKQSIIASLGVTFGIGTFIILMSFMTGLNGLLDGLILNRTPHVRVYNEIQPNEKQPITNSSEYPENLYFHKIESIKPKAARSSVRNSIGIIEGYESDKRVKGITPQVSARVFYKSGSVLLNGNLLGINPEDEARLFNFDNYVLNGSPSDLKNTSNGIILGAGIAKKLSLNIGDYIPMVNPEGKEFKLKIVGLFQSGLAEVDNIQSYANISAAQSAAGEGYFTDIHFKLYNIDDAAPLAQELEELFGVHAIDIHSANAQFDTGTSIRNLITYAVSVTLLIVAGFGIYNILNMLIYEKMNDIAILKATGFSGSDVKRIFIYQALLIGLMGGGIGLLLGYGMSHVIDNAPFETEALPTIKTFPVNFNPWFYIGGGIFAIVTTFFAGYLPARKASKIDPVEILRGQ